MSLVIFLTRFLKSKITMHSYKCLILGVVCVLIFVASVYSSDDKKKGPKVTDKVSLGMDRI